MIVSTGNTCERRTGEDERSTKTPSFNYVSHKGIVTGHSKDRTHLICPHVLDSDRWAIHSRLSRNQADNEIPFFFCSSAFDAFQSVRLSGCGKGQSFKARGEKSHGGGARHAMQGGAAGRATDGIENMQRIRKSALGSALRSGDLTKRKSAG